MSGQSDNNIKFKDFYNLIIDLGFKVRNNGSSHFNCKHQNGAFIGIQPKHDGKAKPYQVQQLRNLLNTYQF